MYIYPPVGYKTVRYHHDHFILGMILLSAVIQSPSLVGFGAQK